MICEKNHNLQFNNSYRIESYCDLYYIPESIEELVEIVRILDDEAKQFVILGKGSNIILSKRSYSYPFISTERLTNISHKGVNVYSECGAKLDDVIQYSLYNSLCGLEELSFIPGTIAGACIMNAGAWNKEISEFIDHIEVYDINEGRRKTIYRNEIEFKYRDSGELKKQIILSCNLKLQKDDILKSFQKRYEIMRKRYLKQPIEYPSGGSVFKRPQGHYVGKIIEDLGLKGFSIGQARISSLHAGFIVNYGKASGDDIVKIIEHVKKTVFNQYNLKLSLEQIII